MIILLYFMIILLLRKCIMFITDKFITIGDIQLVHIISCLYIILNNYL